MKKFIVLFALTGLFSSMAFANEKDDWRRDGWRDRHERRERRRERHERWERHERGERGWGHDRRDRW